MTPPSSFEDDFTRFAGDMSESFSFNRSIGQLFGILYINPEPMSLEDIASRLMMSKGNASINLRLLEAWGAVRRVSLRGDRRDHYEANRDLKALVLRRVEEGLAKRLDRVEAELKNFAGRSASGSAQERQLRERLKEIQNMVTLARRGMRMLPKLKALLG
jgi:HTH-type transcriptional regulator, glycine betaine synthesis regulator